MENGEKPTIAVWLHPDQTIAVNVNEEKVLNWYYAAALLKYATAIVEREAALHFGQQLQAKAQAEAQALELRNRLKV